MNRIDQEGGVGKLAKEVVELYERMKYYKEEVTIEEIRRIMDRLLRATTRL